MKGYRIAAVQMNSTPNLKKNLEQAADLIEKGVEKDAQLVVLPENFSFMGPDAEKASRAVEIARYTQQFLCDQAVYHEIHLIGGGFPWPTSSEKIVNRAMWFDPEGHLVAHYDKIHLFDVNLPDQRMRESDTVLPGTNLVLVNDDELGKIGLTICYDLRFPEVYRKLATDGAHTLLIPSAFTEYTGKDHWEILLRARAIENTCFVVAPAQCGHHFDERRSYGHSMIIDPWGKILEEAGDEPDVLVSDLSSDRFFEVRHALPCLNHRRLK